MSKPDINSIKMFWENNPLFQGESKYPVGSEKYFKNHSKLYVKDCFGGRLDKHLFPNTILNGDVLDLGCGPGFWVEQLIKFKPNSITAIDLTEQAIELTQKRCKFLGISLEKKNIILKEGNAENLEFDDNSFDHVNCQGVVHHTPNTKEAVSEICRVTKIGGTALVSVYYKNIFLRLWPWISFIGKFISKLGGGLKGRGREKIFEIQNVDEIVRFYDGENNPLGKAYSKKEFISLFPEGVRVVNISYHFFPLRSLPFGGLQMFHKFFDRFLPFMIFVTIKKVN